MDKAERELRELWTRQGVTEGHQDEIIADVERKAQPGAWIGPFQISKEPEWGP